MSKASGDIRIHLDRERKLVFDFSAMADLEDSEGIPLMQLMERFKDQEGAKQMGFRDLRKLLWAGLLRDEPSLTIHEAGRLVDSAPGKTVPEKVEYIARRIFEAMEAFAGADAKKNIAAEGQSGAAPGTGGN